MLQFIIEIEDVSSIKDKRRVVKSIKDRLISRFKISVAEVDLLDSLRFAQIGAALVSNSKQYGEQVMQKVFNVVESTIPGRIIDSQIISEQY
jgi:uncharacterized protein YlxP (DUF503 family)